MYPSSFQGDNGIQTQQRPRLLEGKLLRFWKRDVWTATRSRVNIPPPKKKKKKKNVVHDAIQ